jgi:putative nucleotidyltransferase with HDIG domain
MNPTRNDAIQLLHIWVSTESLRRHCYGVAAAMESYALFFNENPDSYWITGLLHDFDYEKHPTLEQHPIEGSRILKEKGYPEEIILAILGHGNHTGVPRASNMAKALFAVDELSGLLVALAKVKVDNFDSMDANSVEKALKKKGFAAAINRQDIEQGIAELGVSRAQHFERVIAALKLHKAELGF